MARALIGSAPVQRVVGTVRAAGAVRGRGRFVALELLGPSRAAGHRLDESGITVYLRHHTRDLAIFKEIFPAGQPARGAYEPPEPVAEALRAAPSPRVLDLGGNIGLFGAFALGRWPGARVQSFEPDPANAALLQRVIAVNGLQRRWTLTPAAVAAEEGWLPFVAGLQAESQLAEVGDAADRAPNAWPLEEGRRISVRVLDLFAQDLEVDLLKMDIEGGEWSILTDPRLGDLAAAAIALEWHALGSPRADPRAAAIELLRAAGYDRIEEGAVLGRTGMVWAWRRGARATD